MPEITQEELDAFKSAAAESEKAKSAAEDFKRDMLKYKADAKSAAEIQAKLEAEKAEADKGRLAEKEEFKKLWEAEKSEKEALKAKDAKRAETLRGYVLGREIETAAKAAGIREEALADLGLVPKGDVEVVADGDTLKVKGAEEWVNGLKKTRPHWFDDKSVVEPIDRKGSNGTASKGGKMDALALLDLQKKDPAAYRDAIKKEVAGRVKAGKS